MPDLSTPEIIFWLLLLLMTYTVTGYPVILSLVARMRKERTYPPAEDRPMVSFVVAAYNEEANIRNKLDNLKTVDYDPDKIEFIIGSDASEDDTDCIVRKAAESDPRIRYFRLERRGGKIAVLQRAIELAGGEVIVFTDCSVRTDAEIMPKILSSFVGPTVGLVSSRDVWIKDCTGSPGGQHDYISYEMNIRRMESRLNSLVSASGSFFAVRRTLFRAYGADQADDFALPLQIYRQGYKVIHRDDLVGYVPMVPSSEAEVSRRARIIRAGIRTVLANIGLLNPLRYPVFAWQLWSHKVLKWLFPFMAMAALVIGVALWNYGVVYRLIVLLYGVIAALGILGLFLPGRSLPGRLIRKMTFLLLSSAAVVIAWYKVIFGETSTTWEPSHR